MQIHCDLKIKPVLGLSRFNPQVLEPVLWEKMMSVIRRRREDFVYLFCFQYRHHYMNWYNLWWM